MLLFSVCLLKRDNVIGVTVIKLIVNCVLNSFIISIWAEPGDSIMKGWHFCHPSSNSTKAFFTSRQKTAKILKIFYFL